MKSANIKDAAALDTLLGEIRSCRICIETPRGKALPHQPNPVLRVSAKAQICICGQAPGTRVHASGTPFTDPSGDRLRNWLGVTNEQFYDTDRIAIAPMGFCFPGLDSKGGDLPPRRECADRWREELFDALPQFSLVLLVGLYAQQWHLGKAAKRNLTETVAAWRDYMNAEGPVQYVPLPHPSWRNNAWIKKNPWFETELLPCLRAEMVRFME
ncbi:MAG: uracil-DNA glycosylase family protein [Hyphomicrobiales bacterium]|nr:uracil-DNA glycosylase family protein [Hyphomicrobiales bacterium]